MYERNELDTQVLIVSRTTDSDGNSAVTSSNRNTNTNLNVQTVDPNQDYIAVVYAGTDDFRNALTDTDLFTKPFGPESYHNKDDNDDNNNNNHDPRNYTFPPMSDNIRVHAGFNNAVFKHGLFDRIYDIIVDFKKNNPSARIVTTGHSLGASDAVLTAVALKIQPEFASTSTTTSSSTGNNNNNNEIHSINFGCPKTGNLHWKEYVNTIPDLGIWRVVNGLDLVPRLPGTRFHHVGHTLQLDRQFAKAYWLHEGDANLGYAGIPFGWNTLPYALAPVAAYGHLMSHYYNYIHNKSTKDPSKFYFDGFETIGGGSGIYYNDDETDDDDGNDDEDKDDAYSNPPDDDVGKIMNMNMNMAMMDQEDFVKEYVDYYMDYLTEEKKNEKNKEENFADTSLNLDDVKKESR